MTNSLDIRRVYRIEAAEARGVVIVIDVIRAFTVAVYACAGGAHRLWLVRTTDEAFALRQQEPRALLAGEIGGLVTLLPTQVPGQGHQDVDEDTVCADYLEALSPVLMHQVASTS